MYNYPGYMYNNIQPQQTQPQGGLKGRPVSSLEEARVANIDFDGSLFVFPDIINQRIYTKQINLDGTASFNVYTLSQEPIENKKKGNKLKSVISHEITHAFNCSYNVKLPIEKEEQMASYVEAINEIVDKVWEVI